MWWVFIKNSLFATLLVLMSNACQRAPKNNNELTLFLASSLMPLADAIHAAAPKDVKLNLSFLSSAVIAQQIAQGAPCDGAIVANTEWYTYLKERKLVQGSPIMVASNRLVLASSGQNPRDFSLKDELLGAQKIIVADEGHVPLGIYTAQVFSKLNIKRQVASKLIKASSARQAAIMLEHDAAKFAILFASDALASPNIFVVHPIAETLHQPIKYPLFSCTSPNAQGFIRIVRLFSTPSLRQTMTSLGFEHP